MPQRPLLYTLMLLVSLSLLTVLQPLGHARDERSHWRHVRPAGFSKAMPIRLVGNAEPWPAVVQDIQQSLGAQVTGRALAVGFYGHGAFVSPHATLQHDVAFVAALGLAAKMDVMVFALWPFPERNPLWDIPASLLRTQLAQPFKSPGETLIEVTKKKARQLAAENQYATAHAAVRLAEGISAFHTRRMTPSLAAFSNSALVLVRLGQLLETGTIADGDTDLSVADKVQQQVYVRNIVTFGYPLPHGYVSPALRQRVQGDFLNVVPAHCWQQWGGNFLLRGAVANVPVSWAPAHGDWPRLPPAGREVAMLGGLLGHREQPQRGAPWPGESRLLDGAPVTRWLWDTVCEQMQEFAPAMGPARP